MIGSFRSRCRKLALSECLGLHFKIDLCIDMGGIERNMSQPSTDRIDVDTGAQQMYRGGVANGVWTDLLGRQGRWYHRLKMDPPLIVFVNDSV